MAFDLSKLKKKARVRPYKMCIYGPPGIGKTTLASEMQEPVFAFTEDGRGFLSVASISGDETITNFADFIAALKACASPDHDFRTLVIDSVTMLEGIIWSEVAKRFGVEDISKIDYGKGWTAARVLLTDEILKPLDILNQRRRLNICLIGHSKTERYHPPTGESYDRYTLEMREAMASMIVKWADAVLYADYDQFVVTEKGSFSDAKKGKTTGERIVYTSNTLACVAKNRLGLPPKMPMKWSEIRRVMSLNAKAAIAKSEPEPEPEPAPIEQEPAPVDPEPEPLGNDEAEAASDHQGDEPETEMDDGTE